ncbi:DUF1820 family protein [Salinisphaera sp. LB1]|uniref:DUF1820 family protein n=1 Tax=Salinisphaera sp. LB1 TaxID=2183911 RepID=UPI000D70551C|nr:DUF1820 family protein [Salinisphaera sp. LB1]AWN14395.1 hypothetical protein SALB1_0188 [Salinisphaera sp. LB1]
MANADSNRRLYRVAFYNQGEVYEVYARSVSQGGLFGFVEIEELDFGERTTLVIDPAEEKLADEFAEVKRSYIPMHAIIRIDEVERRGTAKITPADGESKVRPFPVYTRQGPGSGGHGSGSHS